jgi:putative oxidoreductase
MPGNRLEKEPMKTSARMRLWVESHTDIIWDLVRIYLGIGLFLKAIFYLTHRDYLLQQMDNLGTAWFAPAVMAHYVILAHIFGGLLLALGLITRAAALVQIPVLLVAVFYIYVPKMMFLEPRQNLEFSSLVLFLLLLFAAFGAGRWSLDHYLSRKISPEGYKNEGELASHAH